MKILAANRLTDGETVWMGPEGIWVETLGRAAVAGNEEAAQRLLDAGIKAIADNRVIDAELVDVKIVGGRIHPVRLRERIRAGGPTIHPELGKQANPSAAPVTGAPHVSL